MEQLLTVEQYASAVRQNPDSVRRMLRQGRGPRAIKKGRAWRIPASAVHEDSRQAQRGGTWAAAAQDMADLYAGALESGGELTAITTAPGDFHQDAEGEPSAETQTTPESQSTAR